MFIIQVNTKNGSATMLVLLIHGTDVNQFIGVKACVFSNFKREVECPKLAVDCLVVGFVKSLLNRRKPLRIRESERFSTQFKVQSSVWFNMNRNIVDIELLCQ